MTFSNSLTFPTQELVCRRRAPRGWHADVAHAAHDDSDGGIPQAQARHGIHASSIRQGTHSKLPAIFAGHVSVGDASTGSEQWMMLGRDHVLLKSAVGLPQFDYVALGHVHKYQQLGTNPRIVYSGSIQRVDFGEEKDPKGFCIIELDPTAYTGHRLKHFEFHEVDARNFVTIPVQIRNDDIDPTNTVLKEIGKYHIEKAIVRVMISVAPELEGHLNSEKIRGALQDAHFVASVTTEVTSTQRTRLGGTYSGTTDPRDVLKLYLSNIGIAADRSKIIMEHAEKLMEEIE